MRKKTLQKEIDYKIIKGRNIDELEKNVQIYQEEGWSCKGGMIIGQLNFGSTNFMQTMVKSIVNNK